MGERDAWAREPAAPDWFDGSAAEYAELLSLIKEEAGESRLLLAAAASFLAAALSATLPPAAEAGLWLAGWLFLFFASERFSSRSRRVRFFDRLCWRSPEEARPPEADASASELRAWRRLRKERRSWMRLPAPAEPLSNESDKELLAVDNNVTRPAYKTSQKEP